MAGGGPATLRRRAFELLDEGSTEPLGRLIDVILIGLVLVSIAAAVIGSVPDIAARHHGALITIEVVAIAVFTVEYLTRLWCAPEHAPRRHMPAWRARLGFALTPSALVDLVSTAPLYLALFSGWDLRAFLLFRLLRFLKLARYSTGLSTLSGAIWGERRALMACAVILCGTVLLSASLMHLVERAAQPERFGTIPGAMYWAFVTLTTVGYGDLVPVTPLGKSLASLTAVVGIGMLALPVGILASAFAEEIRRHDFVVTLGMVSKVPLFADLPASDVASVMRNLHARTFEPGEAIVRRGERADAMYLISTGDVEIDLPTHPVRLGAGDFFGEVGLLQGRERTATVVAASRVKLLVLQAADLKRLMDRNPQMADIIREVAERRAASLPPGMQG